MRVVAVVDDDKIRERLNMPQDAKDCGYKGSSLSMALDKDRAARDIVFAELSLEGSRSFRDCILGKMESLQQLVSNIADLLQSAAITSLPDSDV
jgi:hypothetical protein